MAKAAVIGRPAIAYLLSLVIRYTLQQSHCRIRQTRVSSPEKERSRPRCFGTSHEIYGGSGRLQQLCWTVRLDDGLCFAEGGRVLSHPLGLLCIKHDTDLYVLCFHPEGGNFPINWNKMQRNCKVDYKRGRGVRIYRDQLTTWMEKEICK